MDLERLQLFLRVVDEGTESGAARAAHLTQPAISRSLRQLEEQLGVPLFERRGRALILTPARRIAPYDLQYYGRRDRFPGLAAARTLAEVRRFPIVEIEPPPGSAAVSPDESFSYAVASNVASVKALVMSGFGVGDLPHFML